MEVVETKTQSRRDLDGLSRRMLCTDCEAAFGRYESEFACKVFHPFAERNSVVTKYGDWLRKFATSVVWRIGEDFCAARQLDARAQSQNAEFTSAQDIWRRYLLGQRPDVGSHELHLLPWSAIAGSDISGQRETIEGVIHQDEHGGFIYAKLGPFIVFGVVVGLTSDDWQGTRINAEGKLKPREWRIPARYRDFALSRENARIRPLSESQLR
ncbi:hypothetical protein [Oleiharenicola lentus]|uniref:hypothetical protein n=1 Tax=Oleiharenicola lentus TaxID=2508720 RepID=UPI003F673325